MLKNFLFFRKNILTIFSLIILLGIFCFTQKVDATGLYVKKLDFSTISSANGAFPYDSLTLSSDGTKLYGETQNGGLGDKGTIFEYNIANNTYTKKINFDDTNGIKPQGSLTLSADGTKLYGTTNAGGNYGIGTIFEYNIANNTYTKNLDLDDVCVIGALTLSVDGTKLYGLASSGGINYRGTILEYDIATNTYAKKFDLSDENPANGSLTLSADGTKLYGISYEGGTNYIGTIFEYDIQTNTYSSKVEFNEINGAKPKGGLTLSADGKKLYGMTTAGGANGVGTIFEYNINTGKYTKKIDLSDTTGFNPQGSLTLSADGTKLYGMTYNGGEGKKGTIFEYDINTGVFTKKIDLNSVSGSNPKGSLTLSADGTRLYGVTSGGGENYTGTLFEYDLNQNSFPSATAVSISGNVSVGEVLTGSYTYSDSDSDLEGQSIFKWYRGGVIIPDENSITYTVKPEDLGKSLQFEVTPVATSGTLIGLAMRSGFLPIGIPILTTGSSEISNSYYGGWEIILNGSFNNSIDDPEGTTVGFEYGKDTNYGRSIDNQYPQFNNNFNTFFTLYTCGIYHYRSYATNSFGTGYGEDKTFEVICPTAPTLTTGEIEAFVNHYYSSGRVSLYGAITSDGGVQDRMDTGFQYGTDTNYGSEVTAEPMYSPGLFYGDFYDSLTCNQTYHYRSYASNSVGTGYGNDATFSIPCPTEPTVATGVADPLSLASTAIKSNLISNGSDNNTIAGIEYGTDTNYGLFSNTTNISEPSSEYYSYIQNLSCDTTYHYRAYATNMYGSGYGDDLTFIIPCTQAFSYTKKFDFSVSTGYMPSGTLTISPDNKKLYGMINDVNNSSHGALFEYDIASSTYTNKIDLDGNPGESLTLSADGTKFYGVTEDGGLGGKGTIFEYNIASSTYTKKIDLNSTIGSNPWGHLTLSLDGTKLYGMTESGGTNNLGTIFEYNITTNTYTKKIDLSDELGAGPRGSLTLSTDGTKLYGMTIRGGVNGYGVIFEYDINTNIYTKKVDFEYNGGKRPFGSLTLSSDGTKLYGMTSEGGSYSSGTLFELNLLNNIYNYTSTDYQPMGSLVLSSDGTKLFGMTAYGGVYDSGVLFEYIIASKTYNKIIDFRSIIGSVPIGSLTLSSDNKLYGMTQYGGVNDVGIIFEYSMSMPSLIANPASSITTNSATLNGEISTTGGANPSKRGFQYGLDSKYGTTTEDLGIFSYGKFNSNISSLSCSTIYHFRSYATSDFGTSYGFDQTFSTRDCSKSTPTTTGNSQMFLPASNGNGIKQSSISMNSAANIGSVEDGVNIFGYINSQANFTTPENNSKPLETHNLTISDLDLAQNIITLTISPEPQTISLNKGESRDVDLDGDKKNEIMVTFANVYVNRAEIMVKSINKTTIPLKMSPIKILSPKVSSSLNISSATKNKTKFTFNKDLKLGAVNNDVKELQKYLNANGYVVSKKGAGSKGKETTIFGPATKAALIKFQKAKKINPSNGLLGLSTRKVVNGK